MDDLNMKSEVLSVVGDDVREKTGSVAFDVVKV